ncbi:MAG: hypothetical protein A2487_21495 [Candidatus Raymondbacteria bacterium RifOxyC12_full_50_8]|nr:MAG: hypothetical protein A2487_21495 [Candidatus Raymondbacteria bacterium RifOxyC12_full_50_8]
MFIFVLGIGLVVVFQSHILPRLPKTSFLGGAQLAPEVLRKKDAQGLLASYIVEKLSPSVVLIKTERTDTVVPLFGSPAQLKSQSSGSGIVISRKGHIATNAHVVKAAQTITVALENRQEYAARVLGIDSLTDIAVLKIDVSTKPIPIGNSDSLNTGQWVIAIGSPMGLQNSVTSGIVSAVGRHTTFTSDLYVDYVQTDAPINPGNSGGALIDLDGQLIGMNTLILTPNSENIGIGFAIPSNLIAWVAESIIKTGHVRRGWLGVDLQAIDPDLANALDLQSAEGALIARVQPKSPAEEAGLQNGDVVLAFNGRDIHSIHELRNMVAHSAPHKSVECKILRQGKKLAIKAVMGARNN